MSQEDRLIWSRFLDHHAGQYAEYAYDVPIGGADCDQLDLTDELRRAWKYCTAKRIDVLARARDTYAIIEVRYQAGVSAVGALLVYSVLFREHNPHLRRPALRLLTDTIADDTERAARHLGIDVTRFPP